MADDQLDAVIAAFEDEEAAHQDTLRLWQEAKAQLARAEKVIEGEREARHKCEAALRAKDQAMGVLFARLQSAGIDCSDLIS